MLVSAPLSCILDLIDSYTHLTHLDHPAWTESPCTSA
jgi:hypothetical protein